MLEPKPFDNEEAEDETREYEDSPLHIRDILAAQNLMDIIPEDEIAAIGQRCLADFRIDEASRDDWLKSYRKALDIAMQVRKEKSFPWTGASNVKYPLLTTAAVQFHARAYPAIVDNANLVKAKVLGPQTEEKVARAERVSDHMSWQLLFDMPSWEEETDRLLLMLPIVGCVFRKTYFDPIERRNVSEMVAAEDFVVNKWAKSLKDTPRYSQIVRLYPYQVRERVISGLWADPGHLQPTHSDKSDTNDTDAPVEFIEQHCRFDLDDDGYPEPYIVTMTRDNGKVVRVAPCFDADGVIMADDGDRGQVVRIERRQYYSKYGFIPSPDGSFYDIGFGNLLEDLSAVIDATLNQLLDAGALANAQGGFIGSGVNLRSGQMKFSLGKWLKVDVTGGTLRDNIVPLSLPGPSAVLFNLLGMMVDAAKGITSVQDVMTGGEDNHNAPVGTTLARIEQGMKVFSAIYKRIHRAFRQDLQMLYVLNRDHLDQQVYFNLNDIGKDIAPNDYQTRDLDIAPMSDPNAVSDMQKMAKVDFLMQTFRGDPLVDQRELDRRAMEAAGVADVEKLLPPPAEPQPDPALLVEGAKLENAREEAEASIRLKDAQAASALMDAAAKAVELSLTDDAAALAGAAVKLGGLTITEDMEIGNEPAAEQGGVPAMEGPSWDNSLPPVPQGLPGGAEGELGAGSGNVPPNSGAGIPDGTVAGPAM